MAQVKIPYLVVKPGGAGAPPRYYWQPSSILRKAGHAARRVPAHWPALASDPAALEAAAIAEARALNRALHLAAAAAPPADTAARPGACSFAEAMLLYRASRFYTRLRASTRHAYDHDLSMLERWAAGGDLPLREITPRRVEDLYMTLHAKTPAKANHLVTMLRVLLGFCRHEGLVRENAAAHPKLIGPRPSGRIWPREAVTLFVAAADRAGFPAIGSAVLLNEWLGQREGDVLAMKPPSLVSGDIVLRQSKTGAGLRLPVASIPALAERLAAELERRGAHKVLPLDAPLLLDEATGARYSADTFRHRFSAIRAALAAEHPSFPVDYVVAGAADAAEPTLATSALLFRHLRHTAIVRLAEAEVDTKLISAITGHTLGSINSILERYLVRTRAMAKTAFAKRTAKEQADG
jgi:hypothetical protein